MVKQNNFFTKVHEAFICHHINMLFFAMPYYLLHESAVRKIPCRIVWICDKNISVSSVSISINSSSRAAGENHSAHPAGNIRYHSRLHEAHAHSLKARGQKHCFFGLYGMSYRHKSSDAPFPGITSSLCMLQLCCVKYSDIAF